MKFENKVAVVTGGAQGIGFAISEKLASEGALVVIADIVSENAKNAVASLEEKGYQSDFIVVDVSQTAEVQEKFKEVLDKYGHIDILINNAGITADRLLMRMNEDDWDKVLGINLKSVFNCAKAVSRAMLKTGGVIVNVASIIGQIGNAGQANYSASKGGVIALTKTLAKELAPKNVRVNAVAPGFIKTAMTDKLSDEVKNQMLSAIPLKRFGSPEDVANLVAFLCSNESAYITGQVIRVAGGMVM
ncbi:MAG: 3-oxoacyl-[acyl-carrier-protein] reductase [Elusimicrobia bacterium]|nr:3-oxoacyl-[acyl-carrier-protein] reductase [Elusimicrobiota bacterium]